MFQFLYDGIPRMSYIQIWLAWTDSPCLSCLNHTCLVFTCRYVWSHKFHDAFWSCVELSGKLVKNAGIGSLPQVGLLPRSLVEQCNQQVFYVICAYCLPWISILSVCLPVLCFLSHRWSKPLCSLLFSVETYIDPLLKTSCQNKVTKLEGNFHRGAKRRKLTSILFWKPHVGTI